MPHLKAHKSPLVQYTEIKIHPFTHTRLSKRLEPLSHISQIILHIYGPKVVIVKIGAKKDSCSGIPLCGGERLPLQIDENAFKEIWLYSDIDSPDYHLDFERRGLKGKEYRAAFDKWIQNFEEARKTMWIYLGVLQIARFQEKPTSLAHEIPPVIELQNLKH